MAITNTQLVLNGGDEFTTSLNIVAQITALGDVEAYIISEHPDFQGARWIAWGSGTSVTVAFTLSSIVALFGSTAEQVRRVYVAFSSSSQDVGKLFDATNTLPSSSYNRYYEASATTSEIILLDTVAPIPVGPVVSGSPTSFQINSGESFTPNRIVDINSYMLNAARMRVEELASGTTFTSGSVWIPYVPSLSGFVLSDVAGTKRVVARYEDLAGNLSAYYEQTIELQSSAPDFTLLINDGSIYTYSRSLRVTLTITDSEILSDLAAVWISEFENFSVRDVYAAPDLPTILNTPFSYTFRVSPGEGLKTVYVRLFSSSGVYGYGYGYGYGTEDYEERASSIFLDQTTPNINPTSVPDGQIVVINPDTNGKATNKSAVTIGFQGVVSAQSVIIANDPDFSGAEWQYYNPNDEGSNTLFSHTLLSNTQGIKFVYVRFSDYVETGSLFEAIGNITKTYVGEIVYDTLAPIIPIVSECTPGYGSLQLDGYQLDGYSRDGYFIRGYPQAIVINDNDEYVLLQPTIISGVSRFRVHLTLTASGATEMRLSTSLDDDGSIPSSSPWIGYQQSYYYDVLPQAGLLTVYVQFRDEAGNTTQVYSDSIEVIDGAPIVPGSLGAFAILIDGGAEKTNQNTVSLLLNAEYDSTLEMIISESDTFASAVWEPYQTTTTYTFRDASDGNKTVFVKFRITLEGGFLRESDVYSDSIIKDTTPPILIDPAILINGGNTFTRNRTVNLLFNVSAEATMMQVINEIDYNPSNFGSIPFIPFKAQLSWLLSDSNGTKRVYVRFRDNVGNVTVFVSASILLNRDLPQAPVITSPSQGSIVNQRVIKIEGTAEPGAIVTVTARPLR